MKKKLMKILIVMLPLMALILATTKDSVKLVTVATGATVNGSYFSLLSDSPAAVCPALAAFLSILSCGAAAIFLIWKKKGALRVSAWASFIGACLAVIPVAVRGETLLLPNVLFPIFLLGHFFLCAFSKKLDLTAKEAPQGRRLDRH